MEWIDAYRGKRVLVTGHTGFKGGWLTIWLRLLGAEVAGYALAPETSPSLFESAGIASRVRQRIADIRDRNALQQLWTEFDPDAVFHLAAQPLVRRSYHEPLATLETNIFGTACVLEVARQTQRCRALVLVTSDKCYENHELERGYHERDELGGRDVYSASKAAAEIVIRSYRRSFFDAGTMPHVTAIASARAGNVIGGGDWSPDRIIPDSIRSLTAGVPIAVRNPSAVRPWQHVLEPLSGYLLLGAHLLSTDARPRTIASQAWNFGPTDENSRTVGALMNAVVRCWGGGDWFDAAEIHAPHEATLLRLDISKAVRELGWKPRWSFETAVSRTVEWYRALARGRRAEDLCLEQIEEYMSANRTSNVCSGQARL